MLWKTRETSLPDFGATEYGSVVAAIKARAIGSVLAANSLSSGGIKCTTGIKIDGRHFGDVVVDGSDLAVCWITAAASIKGSIVSPTVYIQGALHGDIYADRVFILPGGVVDGDVHAYEVFTKTSGTLRGRTFKTALKEYRGQGAEITRKMMGGFGNGQ